ncbi:MAG: 1-(5-phosphoribosyl)-5-[(5-phosphoribosylamino)methylideneamino]imidazole-4-carboxamide isomerase [Thermodesulfobacteriota bacterium]
MIIFPAVDIKDGRCVRLKQGLADQVTVFNDDPAAAARHWVEQGAQFLHVVDLDGAFSGLPRNFDLIRRICTTVDVPVQLGGGIRDIDTARAYVRAGVHRLIIGTMALAEPGTFAALCDALPGKIGVSLDAVDGRLKTKGWVEDSGLTVHDVIPRLEADGATFLVYTDIARDGMHAGVNLEAMRELLRATTLPVLAAGGVSTLDDIKKLFPLAAEGLEGAITGRAIYEGTLNLPEALAWLEGRKAEA